MRVLLIIYGGILLLLVGLLVILRQSPGSASIIAYAAHPPGIRDTQIYRIWGDGSGTPHLLTDEVGDHTQLSWSADGRWLAYQQARLYPTTQAALHVMRLHGAKKLLFIREGVYGFNYEWSPDSREIIIATEAGNVFSIYDVAGNLRDLPTTEVAVYPQWSPDRQSIVFVDDAQQGVYVLPADGTGEPRMIARAGYAHLLPRWSPDGAWIVFSASKGLAFDLYRVRPDGSDLQQITQTASNEYSARWSPDSNFLLFVSDISTVHNLKVMRPDGTDTRWLTTDHVGSADWSPDSEWVIYSGSSESHLYRIRPDGSDRQIMVKGFACCARWSPAIDLPLSASYLLGMGAVMLVSGFTLAAREGVS